jgi:GAF domain-containing protein
MPDREEKHSILSSHHADSKEQGLIAALDSLKTLNAASFSMEELLTQIPARVRSALGAQGIALWLADDLHTTISMRAYSCIDHIDILPKNYFYSLDKDSAIADCLKKNKASLHKKYELAENDPRIEVLAKELASALLPLRSPDGAFGVLEVLTTADAVIEKSDLEGFDLLTSQIALLLSAHQNTERLLNQTKLHTQLYEITAKINQAKDYESILKITVEELCTALNLPEASMHVNMAAVSDKQASTKERKS